MTPDKIPKGGDTLIYCMKTRINLNIGGAIDGA